MNQTSYTIQSAKKELDTLLDRFDWYYGSDILDSKNIVAYVNQMDKEVVSLVPQILGGFEIRMWFSAYAACEEKYGPIHLNLEGTKITSQFGHIDA